MPIRKNGLVLIAPALLLALSFQTGCATKKYVKQQIDPVSGRVDELSEVSKRNETAIKDVDSRTQQAFRLSRQRPMRWTRRPPQRHKRRRKVNSWPKTIRQR